MEERTYLDQSERMSEEFEDTANKVYGAVTDTASKARSKAGEVGRTVQDKIDQNRVPAAERLQAAASKLHQQAERMPGGNRVSGMAHTAADKMEAAADYVREHDVNDMLGDFKVFVRRYPGQSLCVAATLGFLAGLAFKRSD
jgi:ElaB/YqjD/DUF883 family membrane-anchored ribosome-binding protein